MSRRTASNAGLEDLHVKSKNSKGYETVMLKELYKLVGLSEGAFRTNFLYWREKCMHYFRNTYRIIHVASKRASATPKIFRRIVNSELVKKKKMQNRELEKRKKK